MNLNRFPNIIEILITVLAVTIVNILSFQFQPQISNNEGKGMDGVEYYKMAEQIRDGERPHARAPFVYRIGTSVLAAIASPDDLMAGFRIINFTAASFIPFALLIWISLFYKQTLFRLIPVLLYTLTWHSNIRFSWFYPVTSDPIAILIMVILLIILQRLLKVESRENNGLSFKNPTLLIFSFLTMTGVLFREICLIPALVYFLSSIEFSIDYRKTLKSAFSENKFRLIPLVSGFIMFSAIHFYAVQTDSYSFVSAAYSWIYRKSLPMYLHSWLISFGPVLFILYKYKESYNFLKTNKISFIFLLIISIMGLAGGSDTERILFWSMPVVYLMVLKIINTNIKLFSNPFIIGILAIAQIINMRLFWIIPDYPNSYSSIFPLLTPFGNNFPFLDLYSWHGDLKTNLISFAEYAVLFIVFISIVKLIEKKTAK